MNAFFVLSSENFDSGGEIICFSEVVRGGRYGKRAMCQARAGGIVPGSIRGVKPRECGQVPFQSGGGREKWVFRGRGGRGRGGGGRRVRVPGVRVRRRFRGVGSSIRRAGWRCSRAGGLRAMRRRRIRGGRGVRRVCALAGHGSGEEEVDFSAEGAFRAAGAASDGFDAAVVFGEPVGDEAGVGEAGEAGDDGSGGVHGGRLGNGDWFGEPKYFTHSL